MQGTEAVDVMKDVVFSHMKKQEESGKLSKAHSYDHVANVALYAGLLAPYFGKRLSVSDPERLVDYAQMAGFSHDIIRYASQTDSGEDAGARFLESLYDDYFTSIPEDYYNRFVTDVVRHSGESFLQIQERYKDDPEALAIALAVVAGDKLIEASGPRVLERRSFFVGRERMLNPNDLGAVFSFPTESPHGVLSETMVRLGSVNHISNYETVPALLDLAQELHSPQYHWYRGLLLHLGMDEDEALDYLVRRLKGSPITEKLARRVEEGGRRLVDEHHLNGKYFEQQNLPVLLNTVRNPPEDGDLRISAIDIVDHFARYKTPERAINRFEETPFGSPTFQEWMKDIIAYRRGNFGEELLARLD